MTNWPTRCSGESAAYARSTHEPADVDGDDDAEVDAVPEDEAAAEGDTEPDGPGAGVAVQAARAATDASPRTSGRREIEVTARR